jgi:hypothetical protein
MSLTFFFVGGLIFAVYMYFTIWNIFYSSKKQRQENYPTIDNIADDIDLDGMGNFSRFPSEPDIKLRKVKKGSKKAQQTIK